MKRQDAKRAKRSIAITAVLVGSILGCMTYLFMNTVRKELWQQSVYAILDSTQQGCNALKVQLEAEYEALGRIADYLEQAHPSESSDRLLQNYAQVDEGVGLYLADGRFHPSGAQADEHVTQALGEMSQPYGILDPHISSATGVNVFDLYLRLEMADASIGYLVKEYEVASIVDSFSLSFYRDAGFSYVVDADGNVLIRPPHPGSNKTVQNLFDILREAPNDPDVTQQFTDALASAKTGWAVFSYQGEQTVFCYIPLGMGTDWFVISIIPKDVVSAQTEQILKRTFTLIAAIIAGIVLLLALYFRYVNRTARKLRGQADYIEHLYNAVPEGIALLSVEQPYRLLQLNREGLRLLEYANGAANDAPHGRRLEDVLHPEDYARTAAIFQETARHGKKSPFENRVLHPDGSVFWAAGIVEITLDEDGNDIFIATFHDVTAQKLAEEEAEREKLQERRLLVAAISNVYPVIISLNLTQDTLKCIYMQQGLMIDMGGEAAYSKLYERFKPTLHPDHLEAFERRFEPSNLRRALQKGRREVFLEARQRLTDGQYHWTSTQIIYVDNPYSEDDLAILLSRRIDERRHEEEQHRQALQSALESARAASAAKSQFLSNMSHDIRTPMNAILGMTAIASSHPDDRGRVVECLKKIGLSSRHLLSLINDILDMSKIESGKLSLREEPFDFAELVSDVTDWMRPQAMEAQVEMSVHLSSFEQEKVLGDALRVRQVYINILSNAVKYTRAGGHIQVEAWEEDASRGGRRAFCFRCADTGIGMQPDFLERLFQPFERAQDSTSGKVAGTGLGMAITKNIVDLMGGDIAVESEPGKGSVFTVTLPLKLYDIPQSDVPREWIGCRTLVVDMDRQARESATELLQGMGLSAESVAGGKDAVEKVTQAKAALDPFALLIVDWKLPEMDGLQVARRIRQALGPDSPVIILTANDETQIEGEPAQAGVACILSKPLYRSKVLQLLSGLLLSRPMQTEAPPLDTSAFKGCRVLLAEDNDINREIARILIEESGISVEEACDGTEAVQKFAQAAAGYYNLIFMDVQMPNMDGYAATRAIRALDREDAKKIPIVAMTANAFDEDVRTALREGMDAHFAKPIEPDKLRQLLVRYLLKQGASGPTPERP